MSDRKEKKLFYMCVARDKSILASFAKLEIAKSKSVMEQYTMDVLPKLGRGEFALPYDAMEYFVKNDDKDGIICLILVEKGFYKVRGFQCLARMKTDLERFFDRKTLLDAKHGALNNEFQGALSRIYDEFSVKTMDVVDVAGTAVTGLKDGLKTTIDNLAIRDSKLDQLSQKADDMSDFSVSMSQKAKTVRRNAFLSSIAGKAVLGLVCIIVLYILLVFFCGGFALSKCF